MKIRSFLVDDEVHNIESLHHLLSAHCPMIEVVGTATHIDQAIEGITQHTPDLLFLDIQLGSETGFTLLQQIPHDTLEVIFITAYDQYAVQAIKYAALDYILKPYSTKELLTAVQKAAEKLSYKKQNEQLLFLVQELSSVNEKKIALPMQQEIRYVAITSIIRCEASNNYTYIFLEGGEKILIAKTLKEYTAILPDTLFLRPHQSHLINRSYIKSWLKEDGGMLLLTNGTTIPVSRLNRERIKAVL